MATVDDIYAAIRKADAAGDSASVQKLGAYLQTLQAQTSSAHARAQADTDAFNATLSPTNGMSGVDKFVAGYGKAIPDIVQGIGQRLGLVDQATVDERKRRDAPLMTGAGMVGNIAGNIAAALPTVAIPGAATIPGAALIGGTIGGIQPTATGESAGKNALLGLGLGGASVLGGQLLGAGYRGLKAIAEPFTAAGPQKIAGRTLQRFAADPSNIANVSNQPTITGARPTLAEQTGDVGLARLQDALKSADPQLNNALGARASANNAARVNALQEMTGQGGARDFAVTERAGTAGPMYQEAFSVAPDASLLTPEQSRTMQTLLKSPAVQSAMADARAIAANKGTNIGEANATGSIEGLHNMKMALDDAIQTATTAGQTNKAASINAAKQKLVGLIESISPEYSNARQVYAQMSQPINQMDIAAQVAKRGLSAATDLSGNPILQRNALMRVMSDEPTLIRQATGRGGLGNALEDVMTPDQINMLRTIASETDRAGAVAQAGNGPGSATAQRLASQNILRQVITPSGTGGSPTLGQKIGQAVVDNTLANTVVGKATNWLYSGIAEPKIQQALLKAVLSPEEAQAAISAAQQRGIQLPDNVLTRLIGQARRVSGVSASQSTRQP